MGDGRELVVRELTVGLHLDERRLVPGRVAVVGAGEGGDAKAVVLDSIAVLAHLVRADDGSDLVELAPAARNVGTEAEAHAALGRTAAGRVLRVRPQKLAHEPLLTRLTAVPVNLGNLLQKHTVLADGRAAVHHKVALVPRGAKDGWLRALGLEVGGGEAGGKQCRERD